MERNLPGDEVVYNLSADEIMQAAPEMGYPTISNALQWRLQYTRVINLPPTVTGVIQII